MEPTPLDRVPVTLSRYEITRLVGVRSTLLQLGVDQEVHACAGPNVLAVAASLLWDLLRVPATLFSVGPAL